MCSRESGSSKPEEAERVGPRGEASAEDFDSPVPRRGWRWWIVVPLALWGVYLVGANLFLTTGLGSGLINRKPEKLLVEWRRAWSIAPGWVEVRDLRIRGQNRAVQWDASLARARVPVSVHLLPLKRFRTTGVRGEGLTFRLRRRLDRVEEESSVPSSDLEQAFPEIPGLENPPSAPPEQLYPVASKRRTWTLEIRDLSVEQVREVWIDSARLTGSGRLAADFRLSIREVLELSRSELSFQGAALELGGAAGATSVDLGLDLSISPLDPRKHSGQRALEFLDGAATVSAEISGLTALDSIIGASSWLSTRASGRLEAAAVVEQGELRSGTRLAIDTHEISVGVAGNEASGRGTVHAAVTAVEPELEIEIGVEDVALRRVGATEPHAEAGRFSYRGTSGRLQLSDRPFSDLHSVLELEAARIGDLSVYDNYLLGVDSVALAGGPAFLSGHLEASAADGTASGQLTLTADQLIATTGSVRLRGKLDLDVRMPDARLEERRYDLSGSVLSLSDVEVTEHDRKRSGWWARVELAEAELHQTARPTLSTRLSAALRDSGPVVALMAERKRFLGWIDGLLTVENVSATGRLESRSDAVSLAAIDVRGGKLEVLGDLELREGARDGLLFLRFGILSGAVELENESRDWKLVRSRAWFESRRAERARAACR